MVCGVWLELMWQSYLESTCFKVRTDSESLKQILDPADATSHLARWWVGLLEFDFGIV